MSVLSITAPQFTAEDEALETKSYTAEELEAAQADLFGLLRTTTATTTATATAQLPKEPQDEQERDTSTMEQTAKDNVEPAAGLPEEEGSPFDHPNHTHDDVIKLQLLLQNFHDCLEDIPLEEKEAYMEACERVPQLVELESHPLTFLRAEQENAMNAAERCVNYWELRSWLFGDRAWLPMTATGNGTLCQDDIDLLKTGFCCLLPQTDAHGRGVLCFQVTPRKLEYDRMALVRVIFYVLTVALEMPLVQQHGLVLVADTKHYTTSRFDRKFIKCVAYLFTGYHPITTCAYHICVPPGKSCFLLVLPFIRYFMTRAIRMRFCIHTGTLRECAIDLQDYGIATKFLPSSMGGEFDMACFTHWLQERQLMELAREEELFADDEDDDDLLSFQGSGVGEDIVDDEILQVGADDLTSMSDVFYGHKVDDHGGFQVDDNGNDDRVVPVNDGGEGGNASLDAGAAATTNNKDNDTKDSNNDTKNDTTTNNSSPPPTNTTPLW